MNETLKGVAHIGAELAAAKADLQREMERHRKTWRQLDCLRDAAREALAVIERLRPEGNGMGTIVRLKAALSLQAEPAPAQDDQYPPCDYCGVIPGHHPWHGSGMFNGEDSPHIHACNDCRHLLPTRPAQTEQQPVSWQFYRDGKWWNGGDRIKDHRKNTEAAGIPVRDLYAAPIAQAEGVNWKAVADEQKTVIEQLQAKLIAQTEQPEQSGLVAKYLPLELTDLLQRYKRDLELRTFPDNDEGDYQLRWTAKEIARVNAALPTQGSSKP